MTLSDLTIGASESLRTALQRMTANRRGVLFVCDEGSHLVGVLSDGDVRRSLLDDTLLVSPVAKIMNTDPVTATTLEDAAALVRRMAIVAVPVVDSNGRIVRAALEDKDRIITISPAHAEESTGPVKKLSAVAIIPARGGSKRIPKKNLAMLAGRSLLEWTIRAAREAETVEHILVSTDDPEIAMEARRLGVDVPWLRPPQFSLDTSPTIDALAHAAQWAAENMGGPQWGVLLEPTAPLRRGYHIDDTVTKLSESDADCVMTISAVPHIFNPEELITIDQGKITPYLPYRTMNTRKLRGEQTDVYVPTGLAYAFRISSLLATHSLYGEKTLPVVTPWEDFLDIDTENDLRCAETRMRRMER
jgi:CMP-N,N'-diacetyllegionaminic acid synthase